MPPRNVRVIDCGNCGSFLIFSLGEGSGGGASWKAWLGQDRPTVTVMKYWKKIGRSDKAAANLSSSDSDDSDDSSSQESPSPVSHNPEVRHSRLLTRKALSEIQPRSAANAGKERSVPPLTTQSDQETEFMAEIRAKFPSYESKGNSENPSESPELTDGLGKRKNTCGRARGPYDFSSMESSHSSLKSAVQNQHPFKKIRR